MSQVCVDPLQLENVAFSLGNVLDFLNKTQNDLEKYKALFLQSNNDKKSKEIINIIIDCQKSIKIVQRKLYSCHKKLAELNDIVQEYENTPFGYGESERRIVNALGQGFASGMIALAGLREPTGTVRRATGDLVEIATPIFLSVSEQLMQQVHETYDTPADRFMSEHPFRDEEGNIV